MCVPTGVFGTEIRKKKIEATNRQRLCQKIGQKRERKTERKEGRKEGINK
jgi:hypothetical protein